jgi:hypothetical protein
MPCRVVRHSMWQPRATLLLLTLLHAVDAVQPSQLAEECPPQANCTSLCAPTAIAQTFPNDLRSDI